MEKDSTAATILYDFAAPIGWVAATFDHCDTSNATCMFYQLAFRDTLLLSDGIARLRYRFDWVRNEGNGTYSRQYGYSWIEGIGSTLGFFPDPDFSQFLPVDPVFFADLLCFQQNGALIYTDPVVYQGNCYRDLLDNTSHLENKPEIKIYPNPTSASIFIEVGTVGPQEIQHVVILDVTGRVLLRQTLRAHRTALDVSTIPPGAYYLRFSDGGGHFFYTKKLIKTR